jgi:Chaperone for flagella basal body P-ring formation
MCSPFQYAKTGIVCLLSFLSMPAASSAQSICYSTPHLAVNAVVAGALASAVPKPNGYRVAKVRLDPILGQRWAMIAACEHPDWPAFALPVSGTELPIVPQEANRLVIRDSKSVPVVRAGEIIRLWGQEDLLRIDVAGIAEEDGGLGKTIRVRLVHKNTDDQSIPQQLAGIVRGPSNVEIQP